MAVTGPIYRGARYSLARRYANSGVLIVGGNKDKIKEVKSKNLK